jgi:putative endonuclease
LYSSSADKFYIGYSEDPWRRIKQHNNNESFKFTGKANDWELKAVFHAGKSRAETIRFERFIKSQKSKTLILKLIDPEFCPTGILAQLVRVPHVRD